MRTVVFLKYFSVAVFSLALLACEGNPAESVKESEIIAAIDAHLENDPPASISPLGGWSDEKSAFPLDIVTPKQALQHARQEFLTLFALADAGLLTISQEQVLTENVFGKEEKLPGLHIELTEEGVSWYLPEQGRFSYAKLSVAQIDDIQKIDSATLTVTVELEFEGIADWTNSADVQAAFPGMVDYLSNTPIIQTFNLKFADKQWQVVDQEDLL